LIVSILDQAPSETDSEEMTIKEAIYLRDYPIEIQ
jgi:hypothetical protein